MTARRSDTEQAVLDALAQGHREGAIWVARYSGYGKSLSTMVYRIWWQRFPVRRNSPTYRNIERALARLVAAGEVEHKTTRGLGADDYYRLTPEDETP